MHYKEQENPSSALNLLPALLFVSSTPRGLGVVGGIGEEECLGGNVDVLNHSVLVLGIPTCISQLKLHGNNKIN